MAEASLKKLALLKDQNLLILTTNLQVVTVDAEEYLRLRQGEELRKYRKWRIESRSEAKEFGWIGSEPKKKNCKGKKRRPKYERTGGRTTQEKMSNHQGVIGRLHLSHA
jgi:hypothetical protein